MNCSHMTDRQRVPWHHFACSAGMAMLVAASPVPADVEIYKTEQEFLTRLNELGLTSPIAEGFESSAWDGVRTPNINDPHFSQSITVQGITWEAAAKDLFGSQFSTHPHGITTNLNWARTGTWGMYEWHGGDAYPTTVRVSSTRTIYAVGGWFNTNPDGQSVGFLFEGRTTANEPGYVLPGFGAMYPGDNPSIGHVFSGIVDPDGFNSVILSGTLEVNEKGQLEGGNIFGADDFLIAAPNCPGDANGDQQVDITDLNLVLGNFGTNATDGDLNGDGFVDIADLNLTLGNFGNSCL